MDALQRTCLFRQARLKKAKKKLVPKKALIEVSRRDDIDKENLERVSPCTTNHTLYHPAPPHQNKPIRLPKNRPTQVQINVSCSGHLSLRAL